jgi:hypothetical protein
LCTTDHIQIGDKHADRREVWNLRIAEKGVAGAWPTRRWLPRLDVGSPTALVASASNDIPGRGSRAVVLGT